MLNVKPRNGPKVDWSSLEDMINSKEIFQIRAPKSFINNEDGYKNNRGVLWVFDDVKLLKTFHDYFQPNK